MAHAFRFRSRVAAQLALLAVLCTAGASAQNLAPNPSLESGTATAATSWAPCQSSGSAAYSITTATVHSGTRAARMDVTTSGDTGICSSNVAVSPGTGYALTSWIKGAAGKQASLRVIELSSTLAVVADKTVSTSAGETGNWESFAGPFLTGSSTRFVQIRLMQSVAGAAGTGTFYWDDVSLAPVNGSFDDARLGYCPAAQNPPACNEAGPFDQWKCWQKTLKSSGYIGTNAYRDLELTVEFTNTATSTVTRTGWGFWDCTQANGDEVFRIRTALPAGTYSWKARCNRRSGAPASAKDCSTDPKLNASSYVSGGTASGTFTVRAVTANNDRYDRGFLTMSANKRFLRQGNTTVPFFWLADTAWAAVNASRTGDWPIYLDKRSKQGFTALLFGTAPAFGGVAETTAFQAMGGCAVLAVPSQVPNDCSRWRPGYWQQYEAKVQDANAKGMVAVVAGVMEPFAYGPARYGAPEWVSVFARNLAARLSGHHVIFSPGFDNPMTTQAQAVVASVGPAIDQVAPAHLITHHEGGGSSCADYTSLQGATWHDFHLFQSGHCSNTRALDPGQEQVCDRRRDYNDPNLTDETKEQCVTRRAREMAFELFGNSTTKPVVNGEAVYDSNPANQGTTTSPDNRAYLRQTGYLSTLSGSFGFTYGSDYFSLWQVQPSTRDSQLGPAPSQPGVVPSPANHSAWDIQRMASIFRMRPWKELVPEPSKILNQVAANDKKMAYAHTTNYVYNLAYLPADSATTKIRLNLSGLTPAFNCNGTSNNTVVWTGTWLDPKSNTAVAALPLLCQPVTGGFEISKPASCSTCEWVLAIEKTGGAPATPLTGSPQNGLQLWVDPSDDAATGISAQLLDSSSQAVGGPKTLSPTATKPIFRKQPRVSRDADGNFLATWEAELQDGSMWGVYSRKFDSSGDPIGPEIRVNTKAENDQAQPAVASSLAGSAVIVWMSFGQDGDRGGIYGQLFDSYGFPDGFEFQVNTTTANHQDSPLVGMSDTGSFVVTWESEGPNGEDLGIFAQRYDSKNEPDGPEIQVAAASTGKQELASLDVDATGGFVVTWYGYDAAGTLTGTVSRAYDSSGTPLN